MRRYLLVLSVAVLGSALASAEPLPWSYSVRFQAAGGKDRILLGVETPSSSDDSARPQYITYTPAHGGLSQSGIDTPLGTTPLFSFSYGNWDLSEAPPVDATTAANAFDLMWTLTAADGQSATGVERGSISAAGIFTSGTGNFLISLGRTHEVTLGGHRAAVRFAASNNETVSRIEMTVTDVSPPEQVPEPATLLLAGVGLAGVAIRKRRTR